MKNKILSLKEIIISMKFEYKLAIEDLHCCITELNDNIKEVKLSTCKNRNIVSRFKKVKESTENSFS